MKSSNIVPVFPPGSAPMIFTFTRAAAEERFNFGQDRHEEVRGAIRGHVPQGFIQEYPRQEEGHRRAGCSFNDRLLDPRFRPKGLRIFFRKGMGKCHISQRGRMCIASLPQILQLPVECSDHSTHCEKMFGFGHRRGVHEVPELMLGVVPTQCGSADVCLGQNVRPIY